MPNLAGARMTNYYPVSIPFQGYGLNITVVSYTDTLNFGFIGCRDTLPHLSREAWGVRDTSRPTSSPRPASSGSSHRCSSTSCQGFHRR